MRTLVPFMLFAFAARANFIATPTVTGAGPYTYSYSVTNVNDDPIFEISFIADGAITGITSPTGWVEGTLPVGSETSVAWVSIDIPFDLAEGASLAGFGLTSSAPPGTVVFSALTESFTSDNATTIGPVAPVATPEPTSVALMGTGIFIMGAWLSFKRRRGQLF